MRAHAGPCVSGLEKNLFIMSTQIAPKNIDESKCSKYIIIESKDIFFPVNNEIFRYAKQLFRLILGCGRARFSA